MENNTIEVSTADNPIIDYLSVIEQDYSVNFTTHRVLEQFIDIEDVATSSKKNKRSSKSILLATKNQNKKNSIFAVFFIPINFLDIYFQFLMILYDFSLHLNRLEK